MAFADIFNRFFFIYILKFAIAFCICYFACFFVLGVSTPGGYYIGFVAHYLDFVTWLRASLLYTTKWVLSIFGYQTYLQTQYIIRMQNGHAVHMGYSCLGFGVMSFWIAFIFANSGVWIRKLKWILMGLFVIWCINIARISLLLIAINRQWKTFVYIDHHTMFNIAAYIAIFILIYFFSKSEKKAKTESLK